jgi:hypothetical protein
MRKGKIRDVSERDLTEVGAKHVIIVQDTYRSVNPITDQDNLFYLHSNITQEFCANESEKGYPGLPIVEIENEDGFGTGECRPEEDAFIFPVAAYIHGRIALSLGNGSHFPDQQWDVSRKAAWIWTNKERFCQLCGEQNWMHVFDKESKTWRPAEDRDEFVEFLRGKAISLLNEWQKWNDGEVYGYRTETSNVPYKRLYPDGHTEDEVAWADGEDSCWGFITNKANDIDFPRGDGWEVFDSTGQFAGDEYDIPEFVVTCQRASDGKRVYLREFTKTAGVDHAMNKEWCENIDNAMTFSSWWQVQSVAQDVISEDEYDAYKNCVEKDRLKETP